MQEFRIGQGFDAHRFGGGDALVIGGVQIPHEQGLVAHSDGDVLLHALCDAVLGATGFGDIGHHFPDSDPSFRGADSRDLLRSCMQRAGANHWQVANADCTLVAQRPKFADYLEAMRRYIAEDLRVARELVNIKATTTEGMGFTGRGEGIAAIAVVLLTRTLQDDAS